MLFPVRDFIFFFLPVPHSFVEKFNGKAFGCRKEIFTPNRR